MATSVCQPRAASRLHVAEHPQRRLCEIVVGALCCYTLSRGLADQAVSPLNCSELSQALPALGFPCAHHQGLESCGCGALSTAARASWSGVSLSFHFAQCRWPVSTSPPSQAIVDRPVFVTGGALCCDWHSPHVSVTHTGSVSAGAARNLLASSSREPLALVEGPCYCKVPVHLAGHGLRTAARCS